MGMINQFFLKSPDKPFASGCTINLRTYARNGVGYGAYSDVLTIIADKVPQRMNPPIEVDVKYN
jgi:hypothetical protein